METRYLQSDGCRYWVHIDITTEEWVQMLQKDVISPVGVNMLQQWYAEPGHEAPASEVGRRYNCSYQFYNKRVEVEGKRIIQYLNRFEVMQYSKPTNNAYWVLMFEGEHVKDKSSPFKWKLRAELALAMENLGMIP